MKLFIDDIRQPPDESWTLATTISEAINFIERFGMELTHVSLDHDISIGIEAHGLNRPFPSPDTFKVVAKYMVAYYAVKQYEGHDMSVLPECTTHSSNPEGRKEIVAILGEFGIDCTEKPLPICARK